MEKIIKLTATNHEPIYIVVAHIISFTKGASDTTLINTVSGTPLTVRDSVTSILELINGK